MPTLCVWRSTYQAALVSRATEGQMSDSHADARGTKPYELGETTPLGSHNT